MRKTVSVLPYPNSNIPGIGAHLDIKRRGHSILGGGRDYVFESMSPSPCIIPCNLKIPLSYREFYQVEAPYSLRLWLEYQGVLQGRLEQIVFPDGLFNFGRAVYEPGEETRLFLLRFAVKSLYIGEAEVENKVRYQKCGLFPSPYSGMSSKERKEHIASFRQQGMSRREARFAGFDAWHDSRRIAHCRCFSEISVSNEEREYAWQILLKDLAYPLEASASFISL